MSKEFNQYFRRCLEKFKTQGPESLRDELPELVRKAKSGTVSKSFLHFVADVCTDLKDTCRAIELLKLIEANFHLSDAGWNNLAFCLWEQGQKQEALSAYQKSLSLNPENVSSLRGACYLAIETDKDTDAVNFCQRFASAVPGDREAAIWYATALSNARLADELKKFVIEHELQFGIDDELRAFIARV
jgi:tetratricopeptide (TPR) repeat protein